MILTNIIFYGIIILIIGTIGYKDRVMIIPLIVSFICGSIASYK